MTRVVHNPLATADDSALPLLARCLTGPVLRALHQTGRSPYLAAAFREAGVERMLGHEATLLDAVLAIFDVLRRRYRADYVYRMAIANKLFLGRHSPASTSLLSELRVWRSRADLVMLNGTSTAYEIKTELDNPDRLRSQLAAYLKMFDVVQVVTCESQLSQLQALIPPSVGILLLSHKFSFQTVREPTSNASNVDIPTIIDALRLEELIQLTQSLCGMVPQTSRVRLVDECAKLLVVQSPRLVHDEMVRLLKRRRVFTSKDFDEVPRELVPAYLESGLRVQAWPQLTQRLSSTQIGEIIAS
jgi:hypothetical protein